MDKARQDSSEVRRSVPWLTYALAAACLGGFFFTAKAALEVDAANEVELARAEEYLAEHPYLDVPPLLDAHLAPETRALLEDAPGAGSERVLSRLLAREQAELESLLEEPEARFDQLPGRRFGFRASEPAARTLLIHPFLHASWAHLLVSLGLLVLLGYFLEGGLRAGAFVGVAMLSVLGAAAAHAAANSGYQEPLIGSAGLIAGLIGAHVVRFRGPDEDTPYLAVLVPAAFFLLLPLCLGFDWSIARLPGGEAPAGVLNPSGWALLGGLAGGAVGVLCARLVGLERREAGGERGAAPRSSILDPQFQRALDAQRDGQLDKAFNLLNGVLRRFPDDFAACEALWQVAKELGSPRAASAAIQRVIREELQRGDAQDAIEHWLELVAANMDVAAEPPLLMRMVPVLREAGAPDAAVRALRAALDRPADEAGATEVAVRVAQEAADLDAPTARDAAWRALGSPELGLEERQELESLLSVIEPQVFDDADDDASEPLAPVAMVSDQDLMQPDEAEAAIDASRAEAAAPAAPAAPSPIELDDSSRNLECIFGGVTGMDEQGVIIELEGGRKKRLLYDRIEAVAVSAIEESDEKTVVVVDLVLNWVSLTAEPLRLIRLRSDRFDPRPLVPDAEDPLQAMRAIVSSLLERTDAIPLPDLQSARGAPFAAFRSLEDYQTRILMVGDSR